ncbi:MAG: ECF-type sigma factor [Gemmatimonadaceae bacterium]
MKSDASLPISRWSAMPSDSVSQSNPTAATAATTAFAAILECRTQQVSDTAQLAAVLYDELCVIAHRLRRGEREEHTLQTSALVHEGFLRLARQHASEWQSRSAFLAAAAQTMRRVLVDYARARGMAKRDGGVRTTLVTLDHSGPGGDALDVLVLDDVLDRLAVLDPRKARVVELHVFGGFNIAEIAGIVGISNATATRDWRFAKGWLACQLIEPD